MIYTSGAILTPDWAHGTQFGHYTRTINTDAQAVAEVEALSKKGDSEVKGVDAVKIVYGQRGVPLRVTQAAINTGHALSEPIRKLRAIRARTKMLVDFSSILCREFTLPVRVELLC